MFTQHEHYMNMNMDKHINRAMHIHTCSFTQTRVSVDIFQRPIFCIIIGLLQYWVSAKWEKTELYMSKLCLIRYRNKMSQVQQYFLQYLNSKCRMSDIAVTFFNVGAHQWVHGWSACTALSVFTCLYFERLHGEMACTRSINGF
jgi:hypothetical protein